MGNKTLAEISRSTGLSILQIKDICYTFLSSAEEDNQFRTIGGITRDARTEVERVQKLINVRVIERAPVDIGNEPVYYLSYAPKF
jgi:hypothetical protein